MLKLIAKLLGFTRTDSVAEVARRDRAREAMRRTQGVPT